MLTKTYELVANTDKTLKLRDICIDDYVLSKVEFDTGTTDYILTVVKTGRYNIEQEPRNINSVTASYFGCYRDGLTDITFQSNVDGILMFYYKKQERVAEQNEYQLVHKQMCERRFLQKEKNKVKRFLNHYFEQCDMNDNGIIIKPRDNIVGSFTEEPIINVFRDHCIKTMGELKEKPENSMKYPFHGGCDFISGFTITSDTDNHCRIMNRNTNEIFHTFDIKKGKHYYPQFWLCIYFCYSLIEFDLVFEKSSNLTIIPDYQFFCCMNLLDDFRKGTVLVKFNKDYNHEYKFNSLTKHVL